MPGTGKRFVSRASRFLLLPFLPLVGACSSLFYYPDRALHYAPDRLGLNPREIHFAASDGTKLNAWYFPAKGASKGTIVQFHGNAENMSSHYLSLAWLTDHGYDLFTFDYRGYGKSEGVPDQKGTYLDALAALDQAWKLRPASATRFVVMGQSLGGAIAARAISDFEHRDETSLLVMESTFASYRDVARRKLAGFWLTWPFSPLAMVLVSDSYSAEDAIRELKIPLLVIHDRKDPGVPYAASEEFHEQAVNACWKDFWTLEQGRHIGAFAMDNVELREKFVSLLDSLPIRGPGCGKPSIQE